MSREYSGAIKARKERNRPSKAWQEYTNKNIEKITELTWKTGRFNLIVWDKIRDKWEDKNCDLKRGKK